MTYILTGLMYGSLCALLLLGFTAFRQALRLLWSASEKELHIRASKLRKWTIGLVGTAAASAALQLLAAAFAPSTAAMDRMLLSVSLVACSALLLAAPALGQLRLLRKRTQRGSLQQPDFPRKRLAAGPALVAAYPYTIMLALAALWLLVNSAEPLSLVNAGLPLALLPFAAPVVWIVLSDRSQLAAFDAIPATQGLLHSRHDNASAAQLSSTVLPRPMRADAILFAEGPGPQQDEETQALTST